MFEGGFGAPLVTAGVPASVGSAELMLRYPVVSVPALCIAEDENGTARNLFLDQGGATSGEAM
jgi:hypothetical protein